MIKQISIALAIMVFGALPAAAQVRSSANYAITVDQINSGGGAASSANYQLRGSIGQPFDTQPMSSGHDGRWAVEMVAAAYESQRTKARVDFPLKQRRNPLKLL